MGAGSPVSGVITTRKEELILFLKNKIGVGGFW